MRSERLTWLVAVLGTVGAASTVACRKRPAVANGVVTASAESLSSAGDNATNAKMWMPVLTGMGVNASVAKG